MACFVFWFSSFYDLLLVVAIARLFQFEELYTPGSLSNLVQMTDSDACKSMTEREKLDKVMDVISEIERTTDIVKDNNLYKILKKDHSISKAVAARLLGVLLRNGSIWSPKPGHYRKTV